MNPIIKILQRMAEGLLSDELSDEPSEPPIDLNPDADDRTKVIRVVREHCHIRNAAGGDRVLIDEFELKHPSVAHALLTEEEHATLVKRQAKGMLKLLTGKRGPTPEQRKTDEVLNREREQRAERELYERGALDAEVDRARVH
jgi:hypothetical protein